MSHPFSVLSTGSAGERKIPGKFRETSEGRQLKREGGKESSDEIRGRQTNYQGQETRERNEPNPYAHLLRLSETPGMGRGVLVLPEGKCDGSLIDRTNGPSMAVSYPEYRPISPTSVAAAAAAAAAARGADGNSGVKRSNPIGNMRRGSSILTGLRGHEQSNYSGWQLAHPCTP